MNDVTAFLVCEWFCTGQFIDQVGSPGGGLGGALSKSVAMDCRAIWRLAFPEAVTQYFREGCEKKLAAATAALTTPVPNTEAEDADDADTDAFI